MRRATGPAADGGIVDALAFVALGAVAVGWRAAWWLKRGAYAVGLRRRTSLGKPVISVGNLAVGGTGKTPFVAYLARGLLERGYRPGILARGYGPKAAGTQLSDEGAVLRHLLGDAVPQVEDPSRVDGARRLLAEHLSTDVILLDDGFQHWRARRDLDVVLLDAMEPFGHGHLLPLGRLREPASALARADVVVITRAESAPAATLEGIAAEVARHTAAPIVRARTRATAVVRGGRTEPPEALAERTVFACCGLGNPVSFISTLQGLGARIAGSRLLDDHADPDAATWQAILAEARATEAELVVITRKDAVKHEALPEDVAVLDVETEIVEGEDALWEAVDAAIRRDP